MDNLVFLDKQFTLWLNSFHSASADFFFYLTTSTVLWIPLFLVLAWLIMKQQGPRGIMTILFIGLVILVADQLSSHVIKPLVERPRPSHDGVLQYMIHIVNGRRGGHFGFVSSHAANTFAIASLLILMVRNRFLSWSIFMWALLNCYSRVYCGVHYVGDILCGAILGIIIGAIAYQIYLHLVLHLFVIFHHNKRTLKSGLAEMFGKAEPRIVGWTFWLTIVLVLIITPMFMRYNC
ncbi:MAG: phosphatase PAP2 family protein [Bacteroidales bacterium]|nr:phosphatase PAP2 family protein [Bacteroidales bacterium]